MTRKTAILRLCAGLAAGVTLLASDLTTAAADPTLTECPAGSISIAANATTVCITQQGNSVVVIAQAPGATASANASDAVPGPVAAPTPVLSSLPPSSAGSTYAQRQAIRDQYRGQMDELTFNDELGDGVSLSQALADAIAAKTAPTSGVTHPDGHL